MKISRLFAFDFDGVLCDGLQEYFQVAWRTYCHLDLEPGLDPLAPATENFPGFAQGRSVIETGWEMPLLIYALRRGRSLTEIFQHSPDLLAELIAQPGFPTAAIVAQQLDGIRDRWIAEDLEGWFGLHRFYPGVISGLKQLLAAGNAVAIVSTKEGRFIEQLLQQSGVDFPTHLIFGKEVKRSKKDTLHYLMQQYPQIERVYFVEDRLAALQSVKADPNLQRVHLYLASWGYNTAADRDLAQQDDRIHLLETFTLNTGAEDW